MEITEIKLIVEGLLLAAGEPLTLERMRQLFSEETSPTLPELRETIASLREDYAGRAIELKELASGYCFQVKASYGTWMSRLWEEKPARFSRALLETLALVAYRQPITRAEIEEVRGVSVSSNIMKSLLEREWIQVVGHKEVPGRPALFATTKQFLDHFNLKSLEELPALLPVEQKIAEQLDFALEKQEKNEESEKNL
ncbi:MAG: SMC-Scp complex subunit ScpB [Gammaproteobacteria bacterium]|nr:SMC-Scp complex subunit ScpB [Gammaproteobacteria bacterium]